MMSLLDKEIEYIIDPVNVISETIKKYQVQ